MFRYLKISLSTLKYFGVAFVLLLPLIILIVYTNVFAETNILSGASSSTAWSDTAGWWDFYNTDTVLVGTTSLHGYATSSAGEMALNCDSTPNGNICAESDFKVTNVGASGNLSGCAWNDTYGWISFWCGDGDCDGSGVEDASSTCPSPDYRVTIDANGVFSGYAWNDIEGWISFNCSNNGTCNQTDYKVVTTWRAGRLIGTLISPIIDTREEGGVTLQSIIWQGTQPAGTSVDFQVAVSNSTSGPWTYKGPGESLTDYYGIECPIIGTSDPAAGPNKAICVDKNITANNRYLRYKVRLRSNQAQTLTPQVEDIILNWSE